jgi:hypothetical protein
VKKEKVFLTWSGNFWKYFDVQWAPLFRFWCCLESVFQHCIMYAHGSVKYLLRVQVFTEMGYCFWTCISFLTRQRLKLGSSWMFNQFEGIPLLFKFGLSVLKKLHRPSAVKTIVKGVWGTNEREGREHYCIGRQNWA